MPVTDEYVGKPLLTRAERRAWQREQARIEKKRRKVSTPKIAGLRRNPG